MDLQLATTSSSLDGGNFIPQSPNPFDIIEIVLLIASHLDRRLFSSYLLVNKNFYSIFRTLHWSNLVFDYQRRTPTFAGIRSNRHLVQSIQISTAVVEYYLRRFYPRLTQFHLYYLKRTPHSHWIHYPNKVLASFLQLHSTTLQNLLLQGLRPRNDDMVLFWKAIAGLTELRRLSIEDMNIEGEATVGAFWEVLERCPIRELSLSRVQFWAQPSSENQQQQQREQSHLQPNNHLTSVTIWKVIGDEGSLAHLNHYLSTSPKIRSLAWSPGKHRNWQETFRFADHLGDIWVGLTQIKLREAEHCDDKMMQSVFRSITSSSSPSPCSLKEVDLFATFLGPLTIPVLLDPRLKNALTRLDFRSCCQIKSAMIQEFLCECPRLVYIQTEGLFASDIFNTSSFTSLSSSSSQEVDKASRYSILGPKGRPWVCTELEVWSMALWMNVDPTVRTSEDKEREEEEKEEIIKDAHSQIWRRFSNLVKLTTLNFLGKRIGPANNPTYSILRFRRDHGLDQLWPLKNLKEISVGLPRQQLAKEDQDWLLETFPRLQIQTLCGFEFEEYMRW